MVESMSRLGNSCSRLESLRDTVATLTKNVKEMMETVGQSNANLVNPTESEALDLLLERRIRKWKKE